MKIYEDVNGATKKSGVILSINIKEASLIYDAMEEYCNNNKRKKLVRDLKNQMFNEMPVGW